MRLGLTSDVGVALVLLGLPACTALNRPLPGWFKDPIRNESFCSKASETPRPVAKRPAASIQRAIEARNADIADCHSEFLAKNPDAFGSMEVRFVVTPEGAVENACIVAATLDDSSMAQCMLLTVASARFGPAPGYELASVPFWFESTVPDEHFAYPERPRSTSVEERSFPRGSGAN